MHTFTGVWITDEGFANVLPRDRFYQHSQKMLKIMADKDREHNAHVLFRKKVTLKKFQKAVIYISADDYYKLYVNGKYVVMGPTPCYKWAYNYNRVDVTKFLKPGKNVLAVHTYYQGLINRFMTSGDLNHGLLLDLVADGKCVCASDESFLVARHTGYSIAGTFGYDTGYREHYDARAKEVGFEKPHYDDSAWKKAKRKKYADYRMTPQVTKPVVLKRIEARSVKTSPLPGGKKGETRVLADFGEIRVGYPALTVRGPEGKTVAVKCAQELNEDGSAMFTLLTTNVSYNENFILGEGISVLDPFDYQPFRYLEIDLPKGCEILDLGFIVRHYPFTCRTGLRQSLLDACKSDKEKKDLKAVWELCVNTARLGPQDTVHDCMDRERGSYLGDVSLAAVTHAVITKDASLLRGFIEDAFNQVPIIDTLGAGNCCNLIQLIAEYPLIFLRLPWFSYCITGDKKTLLKDYKRVCAVLDATARDYEVDGLYGQVDKWCVIEWPKKYRGGYDVDLSEKSGIQPDTHIALNMHYYRAICAANRMAKELGLPKYRDETEVGNAIIDTMYDRKRHLFRDSTTSQHVSYIGNLYPLAHGLIPDEKFRANAEKMIRKNRVAAVNEFGPFPILEYFSKTGDEKSLAWALLDPGCWLHMMEGGATVTWEAWGKDCKWNTSLFHNSLSYAGIFMADMDVKKFLS